jgi:uncharacterized protein (PEP-CTERM system associated)
MRGGRGEVANKANAADVTNQVMRCCAKGGWWLAAVMVCVLPAAAADTAALPAEVPTDAAWGPDGIIGLPPLTWNVFAEIAEGYSTNARGGDRDDAFTRGSVGGALHYDHPRLSADASYSLSGQYWYKYHDLNHLSQHLNLASQLIAVPEMLVVRANAFATPANLTRVGEISANGEAVSRYNTRDTYGYMVSPQFRLRFQDYVTASTTASHGGVFFVQPATDTTGTAPPIDPARNSLSTTISQEFSSGSWFERLRWNAIGSYAQYSQSVQTERQTEGMGTLNYAVEREFKVFVIGGYSDFKSTKVLARDVSGPTALGGVTYNPSPDLTVTVEGGSQHNFASYMGSVRWMISPMTQFIADATDGISTPQGDILGRLGNMGATGYGSFGGLGTSLGSSYGYNPVGSNGLALDNSINRSRSVQVSLVHTDDRMRYTLSAYGTERDRLDVAPGTATLPRSSVYGVRAVVSRTFSAEMTGEISAGWSRADEFSGRDDIYSADLRLNYRLSEHLDLYLTNHVVHRDSANLVGVPNTPLTEDQVLIGIRAHI